MKTGLLDMTVEEILDETYKLLRDSGYKRLGEDLVDYVGTYGLEYGVPESEVMRMRGYE